MDILNKVDLLDASAIEWWLPAAYVILVGLADVVRRCRKGSKSSQASEDPLRAPLLDGALHIRVYVQQAVGGSLCSSHSSTAV